jgi:hypothetical protein
MCSTSLQLLTFLHQFYHYSYSHSFTNSITTLTHIPSPILSLQLLTFLHQFYTETTKPAIYITAFYAPSFCLVLLVRRECRISRQKNHYNEKNDIIGCFLSMLRHSAGDLDAPLPIIPSVSTFAAFVIVTKHMKN